jgi:hypothetical protein
MKIMPAIPHRNYVKLMLLAGVPIVATNDQMMCVTDILYQYEFNIHPVEYYEDIENEIKGNRSEFNMMNTNLPIYEHNSVHRKQCDKKPVYINPIVKGTLFMADVAIVMIHVFHGLSCKPGKIAHNLSMIMNNDNYRQYIEVMLTKGVPLYAIAKYLNAKETPTFKVSDQEVRFYRRYIWDWTPGSEFNGTPLREVYAYINLNRDSRYYRMHRALMAIQDFDEVLVVVGAYGDNEHKVINKKMFGLSSARMLKGLREGTKVRDYYVKAYMHADAAIAEERRSEETNDLRTKMDTLFASVTTVSEKRKTLDEVIEEEANAKMEPMEPADIKGKKAQTNAKRNKKN